MKNVWELHIIIGYQIPYAQKSGKSIAASTTQKVKFSIKDFLFCAVFYLPWELVKRALAIEIHKVCNNVFPKIMEEIIYPQNTCQSTKKSEQGIKSAIVSCHLTVRECMSTFAFDFWKW